MVVWTDGMIIIELGLSLEGPVRGMLVNLSRAERESEKVLGFMIIANSK
jgi:hypothetical protein